MDKNVFFFSGNISFSRGVSTDSLLFDSVSSCGLATIDMSSLHPLPWISTDDCRVGGVMCHITPPTKADSTPPIVSPRAAALAQISKLKKDFGLEIKSAYEMEFMVYEVGLPSHVRECTKTQTNQQTKYHYHNHPKRSRLQI